MTRSIAGIYVRPALRIARAVIAPALCIASATVHAAVGYQAGIAANYSDNITRAPADGVEEVVSNVNTSIMWSNDSPRLAANASAQLSYLRYLEETFDDEVVPRGDLNINWNLFPARLSWVLEDRFGQIASDPFAAFTPDNIENTNILTTGPDFIFGSSPSQLLTWSIRAEDQYYEESAIGNQRLNSTIRLERKVTESQTVAVSAYGETVEFDEDSTGTDYNVYEAFLTYEKSLGDYTFAVDAGGTALELMDERINGSMGRLSASRVFGSSWVLEASGEYSFTDSGSRFLIGREQNSAGPGQDVDDDNLVAAGSPLRLRSITVGATYQGIRQSLDVQLFRESERFEIDSQFDREQTGADLSFGLSLNPRNMLFLSAAYKKVSFDVGNRENEDTQAELRYRRNLTKNLSLDLRVARVMRTSTDPSGEYEENVAGLNLSWESDVLKAMRSRTR